MWHRWLPRYHFAVARDDFDDHVWVSKRSIQSFNHILADGDGRHDQALIEVSVKIGSDVKTSIYAP
jgi:hypothetical protein